MAFPTDQSVNMLLAQLQINNREWNRRLSLAVDHGFGNIQEIQLQLNNLQQQEDTLHGLKKALAVFPDNSAYQQWSLETEGEILAYQSERGDSISLYEYAGIVARQLEQLHLEALNLMDDELKSTLSEEISTREAALQELFYLDNASGLLLSIQMLREINSNWATRKAPVTIFPGVTLSEDSFSSEEQLMRSSENTLFADLYENNNYFTQAERQHIASLLEENQFEELDTKFEVIYNSFTDQYKKAILHIWWNTGLGLGSIIPTLNILKSYIKTDQEIDMQDLLDLFNNSKSSRGLNYSLAPLFEESVSLIDYSDRELEHIESNLLKLLEEIDDAGYVHHLKGLALAVDKRNPFFVGFVNAYRLSNLPTDIESIRNKAEQLIALIEQAFQHADIEDSVTPEAASASIKMPSWHLAKMDMDYIFNVLWPNNRKSIGRLDVRLRNSVLGLQWENELGYPDKTPTSVFATVGKYMRALSLPHNINWSQFFDQLDAAQISEHVKDRGNSYPGNKPFESRMMSDLKELLGRMGMLKMPVVLSEPKLRAQLIYVLTISQEG